MTSELMPGLSVGVVGLVVLAGLVLAIRAVVRHLNQPRYRLKPLMTANEIEFFGRLHRALPECHVFPQVAMSALLDPVAHGKRRQSDFGRIAQKRVDWCVYSKEGLVLIAIVELDDRTHDAAADAARDRLTASAGIRTLRYESGNKPTQQQIRAQIAPLIGERVEKLTTARG